ncbi:phage major capsid protein [bacterium BS0013]
MNRRTFIPAGSGFASFLACSIGGVRVAFDAPNDLGSQVLERLNANHTETKGLITRAGERIGATETAVGEVKSSLQDLDARLHHAEQKMAARRGGGGSGPLEVKSWGQRFTESEEYKATDGARDRSLHRVGVIVAKTELEHKNLTSVAGSAGSLIPADRRVNNPALLPWVANTIRNLVAPGTTDSNAVVYPRMTGRTNNAAPVPEGELKPQSDFATEEVTATVKTLAHYFYVSRQAFDDAPALASIIDREARAGLADVEDAQLLFGNNTGSNLWGIVPQAAAFVKQWSVVSATPLDVIIQAAAQIESQNFKADGLVLNAVDWRLLQSLKDTQGRYLGNSPFDAEVLQRIWSIPTSATNRMPRGKFLIGAFSTQAQIFDRMGVEVLASTEDRDNFIRNMVTLRAEERLAFTVTRPGAFVYGDLSTSLANPQ